MLKDKLKAAWKWIKWVLAIISVALAGIILGRVIEKAIVHNVEKKRNWAPYGANDIAIMDANNNIIKTVQLPINPDTGKHVKYEDILAVGMPISGEKVYVEIKHTPTDRH